MLNTYLFQELLTAEFAQWWKIMVRKPNFMLRLNILFVWLDYFVWKRFTTNTKKSFCSLPEMPSDDRGCPYRDCPCDASLHLSVQLSDWLIPSRHTRRWVGFTHCSVALCLFSPLIVSPCTPLSITIRFI